MNGILVSVVIPVYNAENYLPNCLDSVLSQSLEQIEVICVDDGSGDASLDILREYARQDSRVKVLTQENRYAGVARNHGMEFATGKYLAFLDADDFYLPGALEGLYREAERHRADMVKGSFCYLDAEKNERYTTAYSLNAGVPKRRPLCFSSCPIRFMNATDVPWNGLYRREFLTQHEITFNDLRCVNDHSFYIHCLLKAERICVVRQMTTCYRVAQADSLIGKRAEHFEDQIASYRIVKELCRGLAPTLSQRVLRQEMSVLFSWYARLKAQPSDRMEQKLRAFLETYEENDVGESYLREFPYREEYYRLRWGREAPGGRPAFPVRVFRCWQEHGTEYILQKLLSRKDG